MGREGEEAPGARFGRLSMLSAWRETKEQEKWYGTNRCEFDDAVDISSCMSVLKMMQMKTAEVCSLKEHDEGSGGGQEGRYIYSFVTRWPAG